MVGLITLNAFYHNHCWEFLFLPTSARPPVPKFLRRSHSVCPKHKQPVYLARRLLAASVLYLRIEGGDWLLVSPSLNPPFISRALPSPARLPSAKPKPSGPKLLQSCRASGCLVVLQGPSKSRLLIPWWSVPCLHLLSIFQKNWILIYNVYSFPFFVFIDSKITSLSS